VAGSERVSRGRIGYRERSEYRMAASEQSLGQRRHGKFFGTAQFELLSRNRFEKLEDARAAITERSDGFYNSERRHTAIGGTSPIKYELSW